MTYQITKEIKIINYQDGFIYKFSNDDYGNLRIRDNSGPTGETIQIPKNCVQHFIDALEQFK